MLASRNFTCVLKIVHGIASSEHLIWSTISCIFLYCGARNGTAPAAPTVCPRAHGHACHTLHTVNSFRRKHIIINSWRPHYRSVVRFPLRNPETAPPSPGISTGTDAPLCTDRAPSSATGADAARSWTAPPSPATGADVPFCTDRAPSHTDPSRIQMWPIPQILTIFKGLQ